jgi:hypothetical protein
LSHLSGAQDRKIDRVLAFQQRASKMFRSSDTSKEALAGAGEDGRSLLPGDDKVITLKYFPLLCG